MTIPTHRLQRIAHDLDINAEPHMVPIACIVLDITLNQITNPVRLAVRWMIPISMCTQYLRTLTKNKMLSPHWLDDNDQINIIEFWLHVMVAHGSVVCRKQ